VGDEERFDVVVALEADEDEPIADIVFNSDQVVSVRRRRDALEVTVYASERDATVTLPLEVSSTHWKRLVDALEEAKRRLNDVR
jgi:hypothetical protein